MHYLRVFCLIILLVSCSNATSSPTNTVPVQALATPEPSVVSPSATPVLATATIEVTQPPSTALPTLPPTSEPVSPTAKVVKLEWAGFAGYRVQEGDNLGSIAGRGGTLPVMIERYNRLKGEPQVGRELIVPQLPNTASTLESQTLIVEKGNTKQRWVALTLDAGSNSEPTPQILDALKERNVHITFFLTARWMRENPDLVKRMVAEGHEIGNHSVTHPEFSKLSDAEIAQELADTEAELHKIVGDDISIRPFFRPPFGDLDARSAATVIANGYLPIMWTFDSLDSVGEPKTADFLHDRITGHLPDDEMVGAIILAHCGSQPTADALPRILDTFAANGFEVRPLSDVLGP